MLMLMRNQMTSADTDADSALLGMVAPFPQIPVLVIKHRDLTLIWWTREQRERE